jgi:hypothetical protein
MYSHRTGFAHFLFIFVLRKQSQFDSAPLKVAGEFSAGCLDRMNLMPIIGHFTLMHCFTVTSGAINSIELLSYNPLGIDIFNFATSSLSF